MENTTATTTSNKKRKRKDTFWHFTDEDNGVFFQSIMDGKDATYQVFEELTKKDYKGRERTCWRVYSRNTNHPADSVRSTKSYRLALVWCVTQKKYLRGRKLKRLEANLERIKGKRGDHSRHRCGNDWCCNPGHIVVGSRSDNEVDKHFHHFLNHEDQGVRDRFLKTFSDLAKKQRVW